MRNLCLTAVLALSFSSALAADTFSIGNYQLVNSQRVTLTKYNVTYSASLTNTGPAEVAVVAKLTTSDPSVQVVPNQDTLNFAPVPANSTVASSNTFTILVDRSVPFDFSKLHWTYMTNPGLPPIANAGPGQNGKIGQTVTLDGSGSTNPSGIGTLTYSFVFTSVPAGSNATIVNPTSVMPTFVPDVAGNYVVMLTVSNGTLSSTSSVIISVATVTPVAPVANAGPGQTVNVGSTVTLNGSGSTDAGGKPLTYAFTITSRPAGSNATLTNPNSVSPTFVADKPGSYMVKLIVNNGTSDSAPSFVTITTTCPPPVAVLGMGSAINVGTVVQLNGAGSTDACGNPLTYLFSLITVPAGSSAVPSNPTAVNPTFTADKQGTYVVQLIVNNGQSSSAPVTASYTTNQVLAPTANAGPPQSPPINSVVTLNGTGSSDPNTPALPLTYKYTLTTVPAGSNANATFTNGNTAHPTFIADKPGTYVAQLIVNNGFLDSAPSTVMITVNVPAAPTANEGGNQTVVAGSTVQLSGSGSTDPNNLPLTYSFSLTTKPAGSNATLSGATTVSPSFIADVPGTYVVQLIVNNGFQSSPPVTVTITANPGPAASIAATSGTPQSAPTGTAFSAPLVATVLDSHGFPVPNVTVTFTAPGSGASGTFAGGANTAVTNASGVATSAVFTANATPGPYNVTASAPGVGTPATFALNNTSLPPATVTVSSGSGQAAVINAALGAPFVAFVQDGQGNPVSGVTVTFTPPASGAGGTFAGGVNTAVTNTSGLATSAAFTANSTAGSYTVVAKVSGVSAPALFNVTNTPGPAATITATAGTPQSVAINTAFPTTLSATVKDSGGNAVPGVTVTFTAPGSGASGTFAGGVNTAVTNASGVATSAVFTANTTTGTYTVSASAPGVAASAPFALTNTTGPPASISATGGTPQSAQPGATFSSPFVATVKDAGGNPVSGVTVTFTPVPNANGASGSFSGGLNTAVTNASGVATSVAFVANGTSGSYVVNATVAGVATPAVFNVTNTSVPATITASSGSGQSANVGVAFTNPLVAVVKDGNGNLFSGATVTFTAVPGGTGASATFPSGNTAITNGAGQASVPVTANGIAGSYSVNATVNGVATPATFTLTNTAVVPVNPITVTSVSVGLNLQTAVTVTLPSTAGSGGSSVTLTVSDPSKFKVVGTNSSTFTITIPQGSSQAILFVQGVSLGSATLTASASGFSNGSGTITVTPSGFVISGPNGNGAPFITNTGTNTTLTVTAARLDSSGNFVESQPVASGVTASVPVTVAGVGSIQTSPVNFSGGTSTATTIYNAGTTPGSATITAGVPSGFTTPAGALNTLQVNVMMVGIHLPDVSVGQNLETTSSVTLDGGAPDQGCNGLGGTCVTITSSDPSKVLLSTDPAVAGSGSITLRIPAGLNHTQDFYVQGLASSGAVPYSATATGIGTANGTVNLTPSGIIISGPFGIGSPGFTTNVGAQPSAINLYVEQLNASGNPIGIQQLRGGFSATVNVTSSNTPVGIINTSPVTITGGNFSGTTSFSPGSAGTTNLSVSVPAGLNTPAPLYQTITATVKPQTIGLSDCGTLGKNLECQGFVQLPQAAPAGGVTVTLTSGNASALVLSTDPNAAGTGSIMVTVPAGQNSVGYYIQALTDTGSVTYTGKASTFGDGTSTVILTKSGVVLSGPFGLNFSFPFTTHVGDPPTPLMVATAALDQSGNFIGQQQLAGGQSLTVALTTNPTGIGTVTTPVTISGGSATATSQFTATATGQTTISVLTPAGYTPAPTTYSSVKANVQ